MITETNKSLLEQKADFESQVAQLESTITSSELRVRKRETALFSPVIAGLLLTHVPIGLAITIFGPIFYQGAPGAEGLERFTTPAITGLAYAGISFVLGESYFYLRRKRTEWDHDTIQRAKEEAQHVRQELKRLPKPQSAKPLFIRY